jgi:hypothetical protein
MIATVEPADNSKYSCHGIERVSFNSYKLASEPKFLDREAKLATKSELSNANATSRR